MAFTEVAHNAVFIGGPNPALRDDQPYSQAHYDQVCALYGDPAMLAKYSLIFVDSITVAGRLCLQWAKGQPQAFSEKTGKPDTRGAYGLHASELVGWLTQLQHVRDKDIWLVGILDESDILNAVGPREGRADRFGQTVTGQAGRQQCSAWRRPGRQYRRSVIPGKPNTGHAHHQTQNGDPTGYFSLTGTCCRCRLKHNRH